MTGKTRFALALVFLLTLVPTIVQAQSGTETTASGQRVRRFRTQATRSNSASYLLYLPEGYATPARQWPVIVYLHGGSLRGEDIERVRTLGLPLRLETDTSFPFIVISPLCPPGEIWTDVDVVLGVLDEVLRDYSADRTRVYVTGHSMGGRGALYFAFKHAERFAAVLALSAISPIIEWAGPLSKIPVWYFHGVKDQQVPIAEGDALVQAIEDAGGSVRYTRLEDGDHFLLETYFQRHLYEWLLEHRR
jgi:predicted peptidase